MFQDITTLLLDPEAFKDTVDLFVERYRDKNISVVAGNSGYVCTLFTVALFLVKNQMYTTAKQLKRRRRVYIGFTC